MEKQICDRRLAALLASTDVDGALVSTTDGFEVAAALNGPLLPQKMAAMGSSLLALAEAIAHEGGVGKCRDIVVDGEGGRLLLMGIAGGRRGLTLMVLCSARATLGSVLWAARETRAAIGRDLDSAMAARTA